MEVKLPGYTINKLPLYSGLYSILFSGISNKDQRSVVIKLLKNEHPSPADIARLKHEYEAAKKCELEDDIVHVFSIEKHGTSYAIIMENINAPTLGEVLESEKKLKLDVFLEIAILIANAIGHIHQKGLIHKYINPNNIMINLTKKQLKVIDFGLSAAVSEEQAEVLSPNILEGILAYIAPEQTGRMNRGIDYRADYYSLGVTLYQMITGQLPFTSNDPMELVHFHIAVIPKTPHEIDSSIPNVVSDIIMKLLAKKAEERYQNTNGLIADLQKCLLQLRLKGEIQSFPLGTQDIFSTFQIPKKLYGREGELNAVVNGYEQAMKGSVELMLVTGYSGIGKSALVHELHKPLAGRQGYFISGKFDQYNNNIPYVAFIQAFNEWIEQVHSEPEERIAVFRKKILDAVGENGKIVLDVIPNLIAIIGEQPDVPKLGPTESQNRFSYVFKNFIKSLCDENHPLVIFLDDLQWADLPSLKLLEMLLLYSDCQYLFILGGYRSNEVSPTPPVITFLEELKTRHVAYKTIDLGPLTLNNVTELIADTLHQNQIAVQPLARICYEKTAGNPFFLIQLLKTLYKEQLIEFDSRQNLWVWNLDKVIEMNVSPNVVDLMISKLNKLSIATQGLLQFAACIGNQFNLDLLSNICKKDVGTVRIEIEEALKEGYVVSHGESYRAVSYYFSHDRIRQAAYSMIDDQEKRLIHINLARLILQKASIDLTSSIFSTQMSESSEVEPLNDSGLLDEVKPIAEKAEGEKLKKIIFDVVNHYSIGIFPEIPNLINADEKIKIAKLNLKAAKIAKAAAAYEPALKYAEAGIRCLERGSWGSNNKLAFALHAEATEIAFLNSKYDLSDKYAKISLACTKAIPEKIAIVQIQALSRIAQMKHLEAINLISDTLNSIGIKFPKKVKTFHILIAFAKIKWKLLGKNISSLLDLPIMTDPTKKMIISLLTTGMQLSFPVDPKVFTLFLCMAVEMSLRYGNAKRSAITYACFGIISCEIFGDIEEGYAFGKLALQLVEKLHDVEARIQVMLTYCNFLIHWKEPIQNAIPKLKETFELSLDIGDLYFGAACAFLYGLFSLFSGAPLKELQERLKKYMILTVNSNQTHMIKSFQFLIQTIGSLIKKSDQLKLLTETEFYGLEAAVFNKMSRELYSVLKCSLDCIFEKEAETYQHINESKLNDSEKLSVSSYLLPLYQFYMGLNLLATYDSTSQKEKDDIKKTVAATLKMMEKKWMRYCPANHEHQYYLMKAEYAWRIQGQIEQASQLFDKAIEYAKKNQFLNDEALANERAAKFYLAQGKEKIAQVFMEEARYLYLVWGADAKVALMDERYPHLLGKEARKASVPSTINLDTRYSPSHTLDIDMIQKSSQIISSTVILQELLKRLMHVIIENAGAQRSYLILNKDGKYVIEAEGNVQEKEAKILQSLELTNDLLPVAIVNYVAHAKNLVILNDASQSEMFMNNPYIQKNKPKSILCMPLLNQGKLSAILYLENNLTDSGFTEDRINVLNMLSSQMAISIDNASLYTTTKKLNEQLFIVNKAYERFVPKDFLSLLERTSIEDVSLGNQVQQTMSIVFTDIRNFTILSESMTPQENFNFINSFLKVMGPIIRKHNGFVDNYIGEAIMVLYRSADDAVQCALEMQIALKDYNKHRIEKGRKTIEIGIGINTGLLILGTVGEANRLTATVISDAVNIASGLESLTRTYNANILITEETRMNLDNLANYNIQLVDNKVLVKGKTKYIAVYEVKEL